MNSRRRLGLRFLQCSAILLAGSVWSQSKGLGPTERDEHRETIELFQELERRLARIDLRLGDAADPATEDIGAFLRTVRSDGTFVLSSMDRLLEIQIHHSGSGFP